MKRKIFLYSTFAVFILPIIVYYHLSNNSEDFEILETRSPANNLIYQSALSFRNTTKCKYRRNLQQILLAINFNSPKYSIIPVLRKIYEPVFKKVVFCGEIGRKHEDILIIKENNGYQSFACLTKAIAQNPEGYSGYFYSNDDVLLNVWNLNGNPDRVWTGKRISVTKAHHFGQRHLRKKDWHWWEGPEKAALKCERAFKSLQNLTRSQQTLDIDLDYHFRTFYQNTNNIKLCLVGRSDVFYIPAKLSTAYQTIAGVYGKEKVFLETAVPTVLTFLENYRNFVDLNGMYYNDIYGYSKAYYSGRAFYDTFSFNLTFSHPFKLLHNPINMRFLEASFLPEMKRHFQMCSKL